MSGGPYLASEDSALLRSVAARYSGASFLEIGAGNAGTLEAAAERFRIAAGTDLVAPGTAGWRRAGASFVLSDLARCFTDGSFDLVAFNPPYVPSEAVEDPATDAGEGGSVPLSFLAEALRVVREGGRVLMLLSSDSPLERFEEACRRSGFGMKPVAKRRLFYETLTVYELAAK